MVGAGRQKKRGEGGMEEWENAVSFDPEQCSNYTQAPLRFREKMELKGA